MVVALADLFERTSILAEAEQRYADTESYQAQLVNRYRNYQFWYAPPNFDQWPEDMAKRPGKLHITSNIVKPAVDIEARLQAKLPRISLVPSDLSQPERARAEMTEKLMLSYLEATGWDIWLQTLCRVKGINGKGILKPFWNKKQRRPDVTVIENPANLRIGWGSSDFTDMDWALYEYKLSPIQVMRRWPGLTVAPTPGNEPLAILPRGGGNHGDPLNQRLTSEPLPNYMPSDYENKQVLIWDYWYRKGEMVCNAIIVQRRQYALPPTEHPEMVDIPYIVIENDHEPGSPEGISSVAPILDVQVEMNRAQSHWAQAIADETFQPYQVNADSIPGGMVPKGGEITMAGEEHEIKVIGTGPRTMQVQQFVEQMWFAYHRISGIPEISMGNPGSAQVSGRALAVQIEATANRLEPRRTLLYGGLHDLLVFWTVMLERLNPKVEVEPGNMQGIGKFVKGFRRWRIIAPEITPRDVIEHTQNTINKVNAGVMSVHNAMDELGIDSPEDELLLIAQENSNMALNPGKVQQQLAAIATEQQMQLQAQQAQLAQSQQGATPGAALGQAQDQTGTNNANAQAQQAQPAQFADQNQGGIPTGPGGVPPAQPGGANAPQVQQTTLVRSSPTGKGTTLNQVAINRKIR
jgi:hypothetical protein